MRLALATAIVCWTSAAAAQTPPSLARQPAPPVAALAADPDWPCPQRKLASLDAAAIWTGPAAGVGTPDWQQDADVAALVALLPLRRLPLAEAITEIERFASALPAEQRAPRLTLLFAGLFDAMDAERSTVIAGIERYARRQKQAAADIRARMAELGRQRADPSAEPTALASAQQSLEWETRIFNDRRAALSTICEVPRTVEQRLFAFGRTISAALR